MLELAISAGVMVTCLGGTFQFGYTFYVYNQLVTAVGNGARYASVRPVTNDYKVDAVFAQFQFAGRPAVEFPYVAGAGK